MLILLKQRYLNLVLAGQKRSTIRPWARCYLRPGSPISFNGRHRAVCTSVERVRLADLTLADIQADGFGTHDEFDRAFRALYPAATADTLVWVIRFEPVKDSAHMARA